MSKSYTNFYTGEVNTSFTKAFKSALKDYNDPTCKCHTIKNFVIIPEVTFNNLYFKHNKLFTIILNFLHKGL